MAKNVVRIDTRPDRSVRGVTHGWQVRIQSNYRVHTKFFSDSKCGGRRGAKLAAIAYRNMYKKKEAR